MPNLTYTRPATRIAEDPRAKVARIAFSISCMRAAARSNQNRRARAYDAIRRLWDAIDHMENPEPLWLEMMHSAPWAFRNVSDPNSVLRSFNEAVVHATFEAFIQRTFK